MKLASRARLAAFLALSTLVAACGSSGGGPTLEKLAVMELDPPQKVDLNYGSVAEGYFKSQIVTVTNTGNLDLAIESITLEYTPADPSVETDQAHWAFQLEFNQGEQPPVAVAFQDAVDSPNPKAYYFSVKVQNLGDDLDRAGYVVIVSNDKANPTRKLPIAATSGVPRIRVTPETVSFGQVGQGQTGNKSVIVRNTGSADLVIDRYLFTGASVFGMTFKEVVATPGDATSDPVAIAQPITLVKDDSAQIGFSCTPQTEKPEEAQLVLFSNDPSAVAGTVIPLLCNHDLPCIEVNPPKVDFGAVTPGGVQDLPVEIKNCGNQPLVLTGVALTDNQTQRFSLSLAELFGGGAEQPVDAEHPLSIEASASRQLSVRYSPTQISPIGVDGLPVPDVATLTIDNNSFYPRLDLEVKGVCSEIICPTAVIEVEEGDQVIPQTPLHLHGDHSYSPNGGIKSYYWSVQQPAGSVGFFVPSATFPNPVFEANIAGKYTFQLEVVDTTGVKSCYPAVFEVDVIPDEAIHIELVWETPNDPDATDEGPGAGTDMDLHFAHPYSSGPDLDGDGAPDPWFNTPYDVFWFNKHPDWGSFDPSADDDPSLDRDDTDGGGPENVNLNIPEGAVDSPFVYRVAAHYWDDKKFGQSFATVRVYIFSTMVFEVPGVKMLNHDLWEVCTVEWPSTKVKMTQGAGGQYKITPNYQNPLFTSN
jgi:hypothetical protein